MVRIHATNFGLGNDAIPLGVGIERIERESSRASV